ncbi:MAG: helix-turn-helix transcriptional regulator [Bacteroidota bacterium]
MKGNSIGEFEELVLLAVGILKDDAYSLSILEELKIRTGRKVLISSVHKVLSRLETKGLLESQMGGASKERGGRSKKLYTVTGYGIKVLSESHELRIGMWNAMNEANLGLG